MNPPTPRAMRANAPPSTPFALALALCAAACAPSPLRDGPDAGDSGPVDAAHDATPDEGGPASCDGVPVEPLEPLATRDGPTTRYRGDTSAAPRNADRGIDARPLCPSNSIYTRVFSYAMRARGFLRVSTNTPGTPANFDTQLALALGCDGPTLACNDDEGSTEAGVVSVRSAIYTGQRSGISFGDGPNQRRPFEPGTRVLIAVGGFASEDPEKVSRGPFELSVTEVPPASAGAACDRAEPECSAGLECSGDTPDAVTTTCREADPSRGLVSCARPGERCPAGYFCESGRCAARELPEGASCGFFRYCAAGLQCFAPAGFYEDGRCRPDPQPAGSPCESAATCADGAACEINGLWGFPHCLRVRRRGEPCNLYLDQCPAGDDCTAPYDPCPANTSCESAPASGFEGRCAAPGTLGASCRVGACDTGLTCVTSRDGRGRCRAALPARSPCVFGSLCEGGACVSSWRLSDGSCVPDGAPGGRCNAGACAAGARCVGGFCQTPVGPDGVCDLAHPCDEADGEACVFAGPNAAAGRCVRRGALAGTCRLSEPHCDAGLSCSEPGSVYGVCQRRVTGACDPTNRADRCPAGQVCRAEGLTVGRCTSPVPETEPNDTPGTAQSVTLPVAVAGLHHPAGSLNLPNGSGHDCVGFELAAGSSIFAQVTLPSGNCSFSAAIWSLAFVRAEAGGGYTRVGASQYGATLNDCPRIDGTGASPLHPWAAALPAGRYAVCLESGIRAGLPIPAQQQFALSIAAHP